jgi:hypothetical protein
MVTLSGGPAFDGYIGKIHGSSSTRHLALPWKPTNFVEQNPSSEADSHSASQEIPRLLWNPKVHYRVRNSPPLVLPILSQVHPVQTFPPNFPTIHSNILPSIPRSSEWPLPFRFSDQNFVCSANELDLHFLNSVSSLVPLLILRR